MHFSLQSCCMSAAVTFVFITYVVVRMNTIVRPSKIMRSLTITPMKSADDGLADAIASRASQDRYILLPMVDKGYVDLAFNLYETSLRPNNITNYLFVGVGNSTCGILHRQSVACFHYADNPFSGHATLWGTHSFNRKMTVRTDMVLVALSANFTVIHTDLDVVFPLNPIDEIKVNVLLLHCKCCGSKH